LLVNDALFIGNAPQRAGASQRKMAANDASGPRTLVDDRVCATMRRASANVPRRAGASQR
jgi:hypothetical protein